VRAFHLDDAFSKIFELDPSPEKGQQLQQKYKKRRTTKGEKKNKKIEKP